VGIFLVLIGMVLNIFAFGERLLEDAAKKTECHLLTMVEKRLAASVEAKVTKGEAHSPSIPRRALTAAQAQTCGSNGSMWQTISQWCKTVVQSGSCDPKTLAAKVCQKQRACKAGLDVFLKTRSAIKAAALAPFTKGWAAIRGKPIPISTESVDAAAKEADVAAERAAARPYEGKPDVSDPKIADSTETVAESGGGDAAQAAGDTTRGLEQGLTAADQGFADATALAQDRTGMNGDDARSSAAKGDTSSAASKAVDAGAKGSLKTGLKTVLKVGLKLLTWVAVAWSIYDFLGEVTANYTTSDEIQQAGWHYYGLLDVIPPSGSWVISKDFLDKAPQKETLGKKVLACQDLVDLEAQVLGDPTSVANAEIIGSFMDPLRGPLAGKNERPSNQGGWGHVDQDKTIHDPVLNILPVAGKTFDANLSDLLIGKNDPTTGRPGLFPDTACNLGAPGATQPKTPHWDQVIKTALARDMRLAGVVSAGTMGLNPSDYQFGAPDGHPFDSWTLDDIYTFGLGADPLAHYGGDGDLLGKDESIASGRCLSAMALTPHSGTKPAAYGELLDQLHHGNWAAFQRLRQAAGQLASTDNPSTAKCLYAPLVDVGVQWTAPSGCIISGKDILTEAAQAGADPYAKCGRVPLWRTDQGLYSPGYPDRTLAQALDNVAHDCGCTPPVTTGPAAPTDGVNLDAAAASQGYASSWDSASPPANSATDRLQNQISAMALAVCDVYGGGDPLRATARSSSPTQDVGGGAGGNIGCQQMLPSEIGKALAQAPEYQDPNAAPADLSDPGVQSEAAMISLRADLAAHGGDVRAAFAQFVRDNHLAPYNGAWHGDGRYVPGEAATPTRNEGLGDWSNEIGVGDGQHLPSMPSADLLVEASNQYLIYLADETLGTQAPPQGLTGFTQGSGGLVFPPADQRVAFAAAEQRTGVPQALLMALAAHESGNTFDPALVSHDTNPDGSPNSYGEFQMQPGTFISAGREVGLPPDAFAAVPVTRSGSNWGEPHGELVTAQEAMAAAQFLKDRGVTATSDQHALEVAIWAYHNGPAAAVPADPQALATEVEVKSVVVDKLPGYAAWVGAGEPEGATATPQCATHLCEVAAAPVFSWVPRGGFAANYPFGQCTYWAGTNFNPFPGGRWTNLGNGGDWYRTAAGLGLPTLPSNVLPPYGAAVSYHGFRGDSGAGHIAVVISDDPDGHGYWVSEMNVIATNQGTGRVDVAHKVFPDPTLMGSIPAPQATAYAGPH